ncbi:CHAT domain-containing protein [Geitlerinema sp. PCC 9228]|jgi:CHAT domain-containing protein|uniref:CHAT domain-containing protein n=1 Tax=Geitlerinema sp. PCC 9228 TaxID=111611 RepID=UPI0008F9C532|nr:CHAT domain-containing protein [Geitlerinema sp. PCC 9228]
MKVSAGVKKVGKWLLLLVVGWAIALGVQVVSEAAMPQPSQTQGSPPMVSVASGQRLYQNGRIEAALQIWQQVAARLDSSEKDQQAQVQGYLALAYHKLGQWEPAEDALLQALAIAQKPPVNQQILAKIYNIAGEINYNRGDYQGALDRWEAAAKTYTLAEDRVGEIGAQINQGKALQALGMYRRAQEILEKVRSPIENLSDRELQVAAWLNLGNTLRLTGNLEPSKEVLAKARTVAYQNNMNAQTQAAWLGLGNTMRAELTRQLSRSSSSVNNNFPQLENRQVQQVLIAYQQAVESCSPQKQSRDCPLWLQAQLNRLEVLLLLERTSSAVALLPTIQEHVAALPIASTGVYARIQLAEYINRLRAMDSQLQDLPNMRETAEILAVAVQQARQLGDRRAQSYALGRLAHLYEEKQQYSEARLLTEEALALASQVVGEDIAYQWEWQLGRIWQQLEKTERAIAAYREAVRTLNDLRGELVATNQDVQFSFRDRVEPVYRQLVDLLLRPENHPTQAELREALDTIESLQLAELDNFFREACLEVRPQKIDSVDPEAAVIYPIILPQRLEVVVSIPGQPLQHFATPIAAAEAEQTINRMRQSLRPNSFRSDREPVAREIYDWLVRPVEADLQQNQVQTLVFVLDGALRNIPMAALYDGQQYLLEKYAIALTPGLQLLVADAQTQVDARAIAAGISESTQGFSPLPAVEREISEISQQVSARTLLNRGFTKASLQKSIQENPSPIVHLATHGQFSSEPEQTFILTWEEKIQAKELEALLRSRFQPDTPPIDLLVLSACETAAGDKYAALGLAGLAVRSGARSTAATLWSVQDDSTARLMNKFYQELSQNQIAKAEALRRAQLFLMEEISHPFYWAPFVLVGNWL